MSKNPDLNLSENIWDEIIKSITQKMPHQLLPLIAEVFHKTYANGCPVTLLANNHLTLPKNKQNHMREIMTDIAILVDNRDLYHIECQIDMDNNMVIRMIEYDFNIALHEGTAPDENGSYTLRFPNSIIMYPGMKDNVPDRLACKIIFPDGSTHSYTVPTVKVQSYSLEDISKKHLLLFLPFKFLMFRPRLEHKNSPIQPNELTEFTKDLIVILENEVRTGNISRTQSQDYIKLINYSAERVFHQQRNYLEEVYNVTKSILSLPSDKIDELNAVIAEKDAMIAEKDIALAEKNNALAEKDLIIASLTLQLKEKQ